MSPLSTLEYVNIMQDVPLQDRYVSVQVVLYLETVSLYWESHYVLTLSLTVITKETRIFPFFKERGPINSPFVPQAFTEVSSMDEGSSSSNESSGSESSGKQKLAAPSNGQSDAPPTGEGGKKSWVELREIVNELRRNLSSLSTMVPTSITFRYAADRR